MDSTHIDRTLDAFVAWASRHGAAKLGMQTANPTATLDIDSARFTATITYWRSRQCDALIMEIQSGQPCYQESWDDLAPTDFETAFEPFLAIAHMQ
ncbi:hypothetical protein ABE473_02495 [Stenotrophomonas sp. TWI700]|uniref:immunity protein TriTu family protein n=1 Tax=Stenotrophomonas sp. TWI700 TaxID=3136792 RepID=UPI00320AF644